MQAKLNLMKLKVWYRGLLRHTAR